MAPVDTKAREAASRELDAHHDEMVPPPPLHIYAPAAAPLWRWSFVSWRLDLMQAVVWLAGLQLSALREHAAGAAAQGAPPELRPLQGIPVRTHPSPFSGTIGIQSHPQDDEGPILSAPRTRNSAALCGLRACFPLSFCHCFRGIVFSAFFSASRSLSLEGAFISGRGSARAEDAQGTPTQSHISPSIPSIRRQTEGMHHAPCNVLSLPLLKISVFPWQVGRGREPDSRYHPPRHLRIHPVGTQGENRWFL